MTHSIYKSSVTSFILNNYLYIDCILVIIQSDDGQNSDWNMLMKNNNNWLNILINVYLLVCHISNNCGLQQGRLLLINNYNNTYFGNLLKVLVIQYSVYFGRQESMIYLHQLQTSLQWCSPIDCRWMNAAFAVSWPEMCSRTSSRELDRGQLCQELSRF